MQRSSRSSDIWKQMPRRIAQISLENPLENRFGLQSVGGMASSGRGIRRRGNSECRGSGPKRHHREGHTRPSEWRSGSKSAHGIVLLNIQARRGPVAGLYQTLESALRMARQLPGGQRVARDPPAVRGGSRAAFERPCIPPGIVVPRSNKARYGPSSRLAGRASDRSRCDPDFCHALLARTLPRSPTVVANALATYLAR